MFKLRFFFLILFLLETCRKEHCWKKMEHKLFISNQVLCSHPHFHYMQEIHLLHLFQCSFQQQLAAKQLKVSKVYSNAQLSHAAAHMHTLLLYYFITWTSKPSCLPHVCFDKILRSPPFWNLITRCWNLMYFAVFFMTFPKSLSDIDILHIDTFKPTQNVAYRTKSLRFNSCLCETLSKHSGKRAMEKSEKQDQENPCPFLWHVLCTINLWQCKRGVLLECAETLDGEGKHKK